MIRSLETNIKIIKSVVFCRVFVASQAKNPTFRLTFASEYGITM